MKKFINFRAYFFLFLVSICCVFCFSHLPTNAYYLFLLIFPLALFCYLIYKKKYFVFLISFVIVTFLSFYSFLYVKNFNVDNYSSKYFVVYGKVDNINKVNNNFYYIVLENSVGVDENGNYKNFLGNISVGLRDYDGNFNLKIDDYLLFEGKLTSIDFYKENGSVNSFYVKNNIKYLSKNFDYNLAVVFDKEQGLIEKLKTHNKDLLVSQFGEEVGNLAYAVLYGDRNFVDKNLMDIFKVSGVVHLFAVSGLHVGIIVALIYYILEKLKTNDVINFIVCSTFLLLFCFICSFSSSVVRASLMTIVLLFSKIVYRKNDILNSLSFAGVLLLLINPMTLYDGGFQMSFVAVFTLVSLGGLFRKIKIKDEMLKKIVVMILTTLCVEVALSPLIIKFYGFIPTWSLISNLISIPLFSLFYPILFVLNLIVLCLPFLSFIFIIPKAIFYLLIYINSLVNLLPFSVIFIEYLGLPISILFLLLIFCMGKYNLAKNNYKAFVCAVLLIGIFTFVIF